VSDFYLREEQSEDVDAIHALLVDVFPTEAEAKLVRQLRDEGHLVTAQVAIQNESVVGYVALSPVTIDGLLIGVGLAPMAVARESQNQGIGAQLISTGLEMARGLAYPNAVVLGPPKYYGRFGFQPGENFGLRSVYDAGDAFQAMELRPGGMPPHGGLVSYCTPFATLG